MTQFEIECRSRGQSMPNLYPLFVGVKIILQVVIISFYVPCKKLTEKMRKKRPKSIQLCLCIKYCTDGLTLRHVGLFDRSLEVKVKHLEVR